MSTADYRPDVDGLRAIAIVSVVVYHAFPTVLPAGFIGVDVFFVLSGFLISRHIYAGLRAGTFSIVDFYARRCRRILPALLLVLSSLLLLGWAVLPGVAFSRLGKHVVGGATFTSNILLLSEAGYFDLASSLKPLLHLWSLGIEEQFYVVWPALAMLASRVRLKLVALVVVLAAASFAVNLHWAATSPARDFYLLPSRFWELLAGCGLALPSFAQPSARFASLKTVVAVALLAIGELVIADGSRFPGWLALLPIASTALFISAGPAAWWNRTVLGSRVLVFIGLISYPLYLWHWPLLAIARTLGDPGVVARLAIIAASVVLAIATWRFVERPLRRAAVRPVVVVMTSAVVLVGFAAAGLLIYKDVLPSRQQLSDPRVYQLEHYAAYDISATRIGHCFIDTSLGFDGFDPGCVPAGADALLLGDSHAAHLYQGLSTLLPLGQLNASSCPPLLGLGDGFSDNCHRASEASLRTAIERHPRLVILDANWSHYVDAPWFAPSLRTTIARLRAAGVAHVVVIGPMPEWAPSLPQVLRDQAGDPERTTVGLLATALTANAQLRAEATDATFVSLTDALCTAQGCLTRVGPDLATDLLVYDSDHLTVAGATYVARTVIAPALATLR